MIGERAVARIEHAETGAHAPRIRKVRVEFEFESTVLHPPQNRIADGAGAVIGEAIVDLLVECRQRRVQRAAEPLRAPGELEILAALRNIGESGDARVELSAAAIARAVTQRKRMIGPWMP